MSLRSPRTGRRGRRLLVVTLAVLLVVALGTGAAYLLARPHLAEDRHGDAALLAALGEPSGLNAVAVVRVERGMSARYAGIGADEHTPFEIGSNTKTLTGLLLADAMRRREVSLDDRIGRYLDLGDAPAAGLTLGELATHTSGLPRDGDHAAMGLCWLTGSNCVSLDRATLLQDLRTATFTDRGRVSYSNLGAAALGQALAAATGRSYADVLAARITGPLRMTQTRVQTPATGPLAERGYQPWGLRPENWVMDGYQPTGGVVSTASDLGRYLSAVLDGTAPGLGAAGLGAAGTADATTPRAAFSDAPQLADVTDVHVGLLWMTGRMDGHRVLVHTGETAGYRSALLVDLDAGRAVAVLSNVNTRVSNLAAQLLRAP